MKKQLIKILFAVLMLSAAGDAFAQENKPQTKPVVMILGSYHMGNPGLDLNNVKADDVRAAKRQREIDDFLLILKKFRPTKIAVEVPTEKPTYLAHFQEYLSGKYTLAANEIDQIGFRLAKDLNHKQVYPVDWKGRFEFDKVLASAKANKQEAITDEMMAFGKKVTAEMTERMKTATITEIFREMNEDETLARMHQPYLKITRVGAGADFAGADLTSGWYERNLKIFANIARLADGNPNERILVIIGAGHARLLQQFVAESGDFDLEKLNQYL